MSDADHRGALAAVANGLWPMRKVAENEARRKKLIVDAVQAEAATGNGTTPAMHTSVTVTARAPLPPNAGNDGASTPAPAVSNGFAVSVASLTREASPV